MSDPIIRMRDIREAKMCSSGARQFFVKHGLNWQDFLKDGIQCSAVEQFNDLMVKQIMEIVRGRRQ